jgi:rod shape-determining protein MreD
LLADAVKLAGLLFVAAIVQVSVLASSSLAGGTLDLLLVTLVCASFQKGSVFGALGGFFAGLIIDTATLGTLGFTSLLLTLVGYWTGRYGETTGRERAYAPILSVAVLTVLYAFATLALRYVLGQSSPAGVLVGSLLPGLLLNVALAFPILALCRRLLTVTRPERAERAQEVQLLG